MALLSFKLELADGTPADPPTLHTPYRTGRSGTRFRSARTVASRRRDQARGVMRARCWRSS